MKLSEINTRKVLTDLGTILGDTQVDVDPKEADRIYRKAVMAVSNVVHDRFDELVGSTGVTATHEGNHTIDVWKAKKNSGWVVHVRVVKHRPGSYVPMEPEELGNKIIGSLRKSGLIKDEGEVSKTEHSYDVFIPAWKGDR